MASVPAGSPGAWTGGDNEPVRLAAEESGTQARAVSDRVLLQALSLNIGAILKL